MSSPARCAAVPLDDPPKRLVEIPGRPPAELALRRRPSRAPDGPPRAGSAARRAPSAARPPTARRGARRSSRRGARRRRGGPKFQARAASCALAQRLREQQVAGERVQHVLPGAHGGRVAHVQRRAALDRAQRVRQQPVLAPVAAADHVAGARRRDVGRCRRPRRTSGGRRRRRARRRPSRSSTGRSPPSGSPSAKARLGARRILVALVRGHDDHGAHLSAGAARTASSTLTVPITLTS